MSFRPPEDVPMKAVANVPMKAVAKECVRHWGWIWENGFLDSEGRKVPGRRGQDGPKQKTGCWIWSVLPTTKVGRNQRVPETTAKSSPANAVSVPDGSEMAFMTRLQEMEKLTEWGELLVVLSRLDGLVDMDRGRLFYFLQQWGGFLLSEQVVDRDCLTRLWALCG